MSKVNLTLVKQIIKDINLMCILFSATDILGIVNEFIQYVQNYFQYLCITTEPAIGDKNKSRKPWEETKRSKELLYVDHYFLNGWVYFSLG